MADISFEPVLTEQLHGGPIMKRFLALYLGSASPEEKASSQLPDDIVAKGMAAWAAWMAAHSAEIVDAGAPLGRTKLTSGTGVSDTRNDVTGYVIVQAASLEAAARLFESHPHFNIFPGKGVEIIECLPMPGA